MPTPGEIAQEIADQRGIISGYRARISEVRTSHHGDFYLRTRAGYVAAIAKLQAQLDRLDDTHGNPERILHECTAAIERCTKRIKVLENYAKIERMKAMAKELNELQSDTLGSAD